jgi:hypothetical protein
VVTASWDRAIKVHNDQEYEDGGYLRCVAHAHRYSVMNQPVISGLMNQPVISGLMNQLVISGLMNQPVISGLMNQPVISGLMNQPVISGLMNQPGHLQIKIHISIQFLVVCPPSPPFTTLTTP